MKQLKVVTVVGTRPEIIRLSMVLKKLDSEEAIDHVLIHTGQNYDYELNEIFFHDLGLRKPDYFLNAAGNSAVETVGNILIKIDPILETLKPDAFLVLGDTNSCLCALPAKRRKIPVFHMEAGNRCFDQRVPEEINRKIVDHISDINLTYSDIAREYLIREGLLPDRVIKTGSPMFEVLKHHERNFLNEAILNELHLKKHEYFVVSYHREENVDSEKNFNNFISILNEISELYKYPVIVSTHPRTRKRININKPVISNGVQFLKPLGFNDYVTLQVNSRIVLSDSGTISEESSILNFPALNLREAHERPEAMEEASVIMTGLNIERVFQALSILQEQGRNQIRTLRPVSDYSMPNVSEKVVRIILSYTDYVNRVVWGNNR
jgi:UDP-N-acetylglucosamine 2-epimerase (non-hydrolysing)